MSKFKSKLLRSMLFSPVLTLLLLSLTLTYNLQAGCFGNGDNLHVEAAAPATWQRNNFDDKLKVKVAELVYAELKSDQTRLQTKMEEIKSADSKLAEILDKIIKHWRHIETEMKLNLDGVPGNLPDPSHHAFIVLGYALAKDGTMKPELIGRLEAALEAYHKYPQAYFYVTGGVPQNGHTEGELMKAWLLEHGVPANQVFAETAAPDTAGNAANTFAMIYENTELNIKTASVITSGYHLKRGALLLYAESLLKAAEMNIAPVEFLTEYNSGWKRQDLEDETPAHRANTLTQILHCNEAFKFLQEIDSTKQPEPVGSKVTNDATPSLSAGAQQSDSAHVKTARVASTGENNAYYLPLILLLFASIIQVLRIKKVKKINVD